MTLHEETQFPWEGRVRISVTPEKTGEFTLCLRIPGWAQGRLMPSDLYRFDNPEPVKWTATVNGKPLSAGPLEKGYLRIGRAWKAGDVGGTESSHARAPRVFARERQLHSRRKPRSIAARCCIVWRAWTIPASAC